MRRGWWFVVGAGLAAQTHIEQLHVMAPMRDGVRLSANVYRPAAPARAPVLLMRTPYSKPELNPGLRAFVDHGYAVVVQDVRGRYASEGVFHPFVQEQNDGEDTLNWLVRQPWCDGRIGMFGNSYAGITQWRAALTGHAALKAIAPGVSGNDEFLDRYYSPGGAYRIGQRLLWIAENLRPPSFPFPQFEHLVEVMPLRAADRAATGRAIDFYQESLDHPFNDDYWRSRSTRLRLDHVQAAVLIESGWYDPFAESDLESFRLLRRRNHPVRMVIGAWGHNMLTPMPNENFGVDSRPPMRTYEIEWFDTHVKGLGPATHSAPLQVYVMGENRWREASVWPPPAVPMTLYLESDGKLQHKSGLKARTVELRSDPRSPVPSRGGALCCNFTHQPWGPVDQRQLDGRNDILRFATEPLKKPLRVMGEVFVQLTVASDAPDTDFTAKLIDVAPDGVARLVTDGILRLRYRAGIDHAAAYRPGEVITVQVSAGTTAHAFLAGHRIRVDIAGSNFPRFDRNPNTGRPIADENNPRVAHDTIHLGGKRASRVVLPEAP